MKIVKGFTPQGEIVKISEVGKYEDFILKCKERLCSAAQLEIMLQTRKTLLNYKKALEYYKKYPYQYLIQRADVMRNIADLYCQRGKSEEDINSKMGEQCYSYLAEAYELYRSNADLHGIADVLQSMGNAEDFSKMNKNSRSSLSFYKVAEDIYISLGDLWSSVVVSKFKEGIVKK